MQEFWYDYTKPKYSENSKLFYMDTNRFIVHVKANDICKDILEGVKTRLTLYDTNFEIYRPLPKEKSKKSKWTNERSANQRQANVDKL